MWHAGDVYLGTVSVWRYGAKPHLALTLCDYYIHESTGFRRPRRVPTAEGGGSPTKYPERGSA